jgi:hypothetical protein
MQAIVLAAITGSLMFLSAADAAAFLDGEIEP